MNPATVSICIPLYCKEEFLGETIKSVLRQTFTDFELLIFDNASPDRSLEVAMSFDDPRIIVRRLPDTIPAAENFRAVVSAARGTLVKLLCADDLLYPQCLAREVAVLQQDPTLALVTCRHDLIDQDGSLIAPDNGLRYHDLVGRQERGTIIRRLVRHGGIPVGAVGNVLFRRSAYEAAGGFARDSFFTVDVEAWTRLLHHGGYHGIPETLAAFRVSAGSASHGVGSAGVRAQRAFVGRLRRNDAALLRRSDRLHGAARAPLTWLRHHLLFAAAAPPGSARNRVATRLLRLRRPTGDPVTGDPAQGRVAILETDPFGHRLHYLAHLADALGPQRCTILTSERALCSAEYRQLADVLTGPVRLLPASASRHATLSAAAALAADSGAVRLVVPDGDRYLVPLLWLLLSGPRGTLQWRLLLMRTTTVGGPERLRPATLVKPLLVRLLRSFPQVQLLFLTDALGVVRQRRGYPGLSAVRDPVRRPPTPAPERPSWLPATPAGEVLVGVFGGISARKNLPLLVDALTGHVAGRLVVGGRLEPDMRAYLDADPHAVALIAADRMTVEDRLLEPVELAAALASVDLVAVLHDNDSPSGILGEACVRGTPVLVPTGGWLATVVDACGIGVTTELTPDAVARGIRRLGRDRERYVAATRRHAPRIDTSDFTEQLVGR